jgi:hypothetical protein
LAGLVKKRERVGRTGFEPVKAKPEDLQSSPVGHLGICPKREGRAYDMLR